MSKTLTLTIGERLAALKIFDGFTGGSVLQLGAIMDDIKAFPITEEEWTAADRKIEKTETGETWKWDETKVNKDITLQDVSAEYLAKTISAKTDVTAKDIHLVTLNKKLS